MYEHSLVFSLFYEYLRINRVTPKDTKIREIVNTRIDFFSASRFSSMEWVRGDEIGCGSFSTVSLAVLKNPTPRFPQIMAVKSASVSQSDMLLREKLILEELGDCPHIVKCFGGDYSIEKGETFYNLFLEYATGGTLADNMKKQINRRFSESKVRRYTKSILEGVKHIHENGYVHCDIKLENIFLCSERDEVKIADLGLAMGAGESETRRGRGGGIELRGTPLYMSPETVAEGQQGAPADVWAVGCLVAEMVAGAPAWRCRQGSGMLRLLMRIGVGDEVPEVPEDLSPEGRDFLERIFVKDPKERWTAQMLLDHPFVRGPDCMACFLPSPRGPFDCIDDCECSTTETPSSDFDTWHSGQVDYCAMTETPLSDFNMWHSEQVDYCATTKTPASDIDDCADRLQKLVTGQGPDWSETDGWMDVRQ